MPPAAWSPAGWPCCHPAPAGCPCWRPGAAPAPSAGSPQRIGTTSSTTDRCTAGAAAAAGSAVAMGWSPSSGALRSGTADHHGPGSGPGDGSSGTETGASEGGAEGGAARSRSTVGSTAGGVPVDVCWTTGGSAPAAPVEADAAGSPVLGPTAAGGLSGPPAGSICTTGPVSGGSGTRCCGGRVSGAPRPRRRGPASGDRWTTGPGGVGSGAPRPRRRGAAGPAGATGPVASRLTVGASASVTEVTSPGTSSTGASARSGARSGASGRLGVPDGDDPVCATSAAKAAVAAAGVPAGPGPSWASPDVVTGAAPSATDDPAPVEVGRSVIDPTARCTTPSPAGTTGSAGRAVGGGGAVTNDRTGVASTRTGNWDNGRPGASTDRCSIAGGSASVRGSGVAPRTGRPGSGSATERGATGGPSTASATESGAEEPVSPTVGSPAVGPVDDGPELDAEELDADEPAGGTPTAADPTLASGAGSADAATGDRPAAPDDGPSDRCTTAGDPSSRPADSAPDPDSLAADSARCTTNPAGWSNRTSRCTGAVADPGSVEVVSGDSGTPATGSSATPGGPGVASTIPTADPDGADGPRPCASSVSMRGLCQVARLPAKSPSRATGCTPSPRLRCTGGSARHPGSDTGAAPRPEGSPPDGRLGAEVPPVSRSLTPRSQDHRPIPVTSPAVPGRSSC